MLPEWPLSMGKCTNSRNPNIMTTDHWSHTLPSFDMIEKQSWSKWFLSLVNHCFRGTQIIIEAKYGECFSHLMCVCVFVCVIRLVLKSKLFLLIEWVNSIHSRVVLTRNGIHDHWSLISRNSSTEKHNIFLVMFWSISNHDWNSCFQRLFDSHTI